MGFVNIFIVIAIALCSGVLSINPNESFKVDQQYESVGESGCVNTCNGIDGTNTQNENKGPLVPPVLQFLDITEEYRLHLKWDIQFDVKDYVDSYMIEVKNILPVNPQLKNCQVFKSNLSSYEYSCFQVTAGGTYEVILTSFPQQLRTIYSVFIPAKVENSLVKPSVIQWKPVIGLGLQIVPCTNQSLHVILQPVPNLTLYNNISVSLISPGRYDLQQMIPEGQSSTYFPSIKPELSYNVSVYIDNPSCTFECEGLNSSACCDLLSVNLTAAEENCATAPMVLERSTPSMLSSISTSSLPQSSADLESISSTNDPSVTKTRAVDPQQKRDEIIIAAILSVAVTAVLASVIGFCLYRRKRRHLGGGFPMRRMRQENGSDSISLNFDKASAKITPAVLLLYSFDCDAHEAVVIEFASYLKHECECEVFLDIWAQADIQSKGAAQWWNEKIDKCTHVAVISSSGARFKCNRKKPFHMEKERPVPDMFVYGVNQIAEKLRNAKDANIQIPTCQVICFEYSTSSDIPPKLDTLTRFKMMQDLQLYYTSLIGESNPDHMSLYGKTIENYNKTVTGKQLHEALCNAMQFFKNNPNWLAEIIEPIVPVNGSLRSSNGNDSESSSLHKQTLEKEVPKNLVPETSIGEENRQMTTQIHSRVPSIAASVTSEDETLLEERRKRREKEKETHLEKVPSFTKLSGLDKIIETDPDPPKKLFTHSDNLEKHSQVNVEETNKNAPKIVNDKFKPFYSSSIHTSRQSSVSNGIVGQGDFECADDVDEMAELQKDIDFIHNYQWHNVTDPTDLLLQTDFGPGDLTPSYEESPSSFSNPLYSESSTKHMLRKNGLGRVSVGLKHKKKLLNNNNDFTVDFMTSSDRYQDSSTQL